jgi:hypothetical protein
MSTYNLYNVVSCVNCYNYNSGSSLLGGCIYNLDWLIGVIPMLVFLVCGYCLYIYIYIYVCVCVGVGVLCIC